MSSSAASRILLALVALAASLFGSCAAPQAKPAAGAGSGIAALAWMSGHWRAVEDGKGSEEVWLAPEGGLMVGASRTLDGGRAVFFEYMRIVEDEHGIRLLASPAGKAPTPFQLIESGARRAVFENKEHDFPQRILYWIDEPGVLRARVEGLLDGQPQGEDFRFERVVAKVAPRPASFSRWKRS